MLSLQQAIEIKESIISYLKATFTFREKQVAQSFDEFIEDTKQGMFKGPYLSVRLPFTKTTDTEIPLDIKPAWHPYRHQAISWQRLSTHHRQPQPTILTTGTGSGKTEAFLYPILDYCHQQRHRKGVKAIILYPMNALATDQAKRLAEAIFQDKRLNGITAGLFIGEGNSGADLPKVMQEHRIIEHRDTILDTTPDIVLTNFKMLDYALMKHNYHGLWVNNITDQELLKFLVLDELHTYDGAQGTDVANLIRRLKLKLKIAKKTLCSVGTSATIGSGTDAPQLLAEYATKVFGEEIDTSAIIAEDRLSLTAYFGDDDNLEEYLPRINTLNDLEFRESEEFDKYLREHFTAWQLDENNLAKGLLKLKIVKDLVEVCNKEKNTQTLDNIVRLLSNINPNFRKVPQWDKGEQFNPKERIIQSLLTVIGAAKNPDDNRTPFLYLQTQLWIRELSGVQYTLEPEPKFSFRDQVEAQQEIAALPPWYCRECNSSGWLGVKNDDREELSKNINEVYDKFFNHHKNIYFLLPGGKLEAEDLNTTGYQPDDFLELNIDPVTLKILDKHDENGLGIQALRKLNDNKTQHICPCCNSLNTVAVIGTKIPTLSSISVSQTLATDLDPAGDKDRKVLAFTNAVQDAAHQAGFVEARNYRFTFRASLQKVINELDGPVSLSDLSIRFIEYWKNHADETGQDKLSGYLYRFFPKDYIGKSSPNDYKQGSHYEQHFLDEFDLRIQWEMYAEFGFNSLIGRTLEKTGASSVYFDNRLLQTAWGYMEQWIASNDTTNSITEADWLRFTNLILHRMRNRGAVSHPFLNKFREGDFKLWDLNWMRDNRHFLNQRFSPRSRLPKLLTHQNHRGNLLDTTHTTTTNWFHGYFQKSFPLANPLPDFINEFYEEWAMALVNAGVLDRKLAGNQESFTILPEAIRVKKNVEHYRCDVCEQVVYSNDERAMTEGGSCLAYRCTGHYVRQTVTPQNYYKAVYNRSRFPRIYAADHTGLLSREKREALETDFKNRTKFNSINTLVATSTLEMGIDIGDLNTAYNNSVPPLPSNFLQRVGRAGRASGDALLINFAKHQNHDLYYFADPLEMMAGDVNSPGCYLEAKDILRRHFTAFCLDSWTSKNPKEHAIPNFIRDLKLESRNLTEADFFINKIISFIRSEKTVLVHDFLSQYPHHISLQFEPIQEALNNETFYNQLQDVFTRLKNELHYLEQLREEADKKQKELKLAKGDPLYGELDREKRNLSGIKKSVQERNIVEHLTNVGVLPNYAFPESGVVLNAHVLPAKAEGATNERPPIDFEIVRSASQAIKEFAPENFFYTQGYRFEITGVNVFDWSDKNNYHTKRFCSRCDHLEIDSIAPKGNCPKCGDPSWASSSNVHSFVRLTNLKSFNSESKASVTDANEDRELIPYQIVNHLHIEQDTSEGAWVLKDIPFGIEYVKAVEISSVNYGRGDVIDARRIKINGDEAMSKGFITCRYCGRSSSRIRQQDHKYHYGYCKHNDKKYNNQPDDVFEEIYFFRNFKTEILKIVLPIQEFNSEADIRMFQAGIELGLKKYFKGNPEHIRILSYREYNQKTDKFDRFLILYDTIPGGTGYLKQLFDYKEFNLLLRKSYEAIRDCECQFQGKDGCYKCIYSYGNQYNRADLSRERAERWFESIVNISNEWENKPEGLTSLTNSGKIEESELEERFIKLFSIWAEKTEGYKFEPVKIDGVTQYKLLIEKDDIHATYWIQPQRPLGPADGIAFSTRTDFLIRCSQYKINETDYAEQIKKIAVYLDGYQFHASEEHNIFEKDLKIRQAISENTEFKSWSITWKDLDDLDQQLSDKDKIQDDVSGRFNEHYKTNYHKLLGTIRNNHKTDYSYSGINVLRLVDQLTYPVNTTNETSWYFYLASQTSALLTPSFNPGDLNKVISGTLLNGNYLLENKISDFDALIPLEGLPSFDFVEWKAWVNVNRKQVYHLLKATDTTKIDKKQWESFWRYFNILQSDIFIDPASFAEEYISKTDAAGQLFEGIKIYYDEIYHAFLQSAIKNGIITEENQDAINSLIDSNGKVIAEAEFVLKHLKIAISPFNEEDEKVFLQQGFSVYKNDELDKISI